MAEEATKVESGRRKKLWGAGLAGFVSGLVAMALFVYAVMPGMMIKTYRTTAGVEETVETLRSALKERDWSSPGTLNMNKSLARHGVRFEPEVRVLQMCHPEYASSVLKTDRYVASLMPCAIAVWEGNDGNTYLSKMNTGLMGKLFGGKIAEIMGGHVAEDEHAILQAVLKK